MSAPPHYLRIAEGEMLPDISRYAPFRAVVVIDAPYSSAWQTEVSEWLVASGCLYMMAWGEGCSSWDDSVDYANLEAFDYGEIPDERFVMTTWHERQTLGEVFREARFAADHGDVALEETLLVHVGERDRKTEFLTLYAQAEASVDREEDRL